ncbi:hypothetical protein J6590_044095 [Homalodisca vitripennis]|nr:hypothetical protein J6590_044095 [Homalodisca vitripennis]
MPCYGVRVCCFCIPLQHGCIIIGVFLVLEAMMRLQDNVKLLEQLVRQGSRIEMKEKIWMYNSMGSCLLQIIVGVMVVTGYCTQIPKLFKCSAFILILLAVTALLTGVFRSVQIMHAPTIPLSVFTFVLLSYFALIVWSYAMELEGLHEEMPYT